MKPSTNRRNLIPADQAKPALLIIDMINDMEFDEGDQLLEFARPAANALEQLKQRFRAAEFPVVYANDNFGRWQSNFHSQFDHCVQPGVRGNEIAK
ncbi:MAG TPA: isochorismatase family protein, partial [Pirellula sp.]|nr:isochorismatase family protein [Pirellula sp.]